MNLDTITQKLTAFSSFSEMVFETSKSYRPSMNVTDPEYGIEFMILADAYDQAQAKRGDERRVYRF